MNLPELPEPSHKPRWPGDDALYTKGLMKAYGKLFAIEALEEAAKECEAQEGYGPRNETNYECAESIRKLKDTL